MLILTLLLVQALTVMIEQSNAIPWPYQICGDGNWTVETLTIESVPKRNTDD